MTATITLDRIREQEQETHRSATTDHGGHFDVIAHTEAGVIVRSIVTGAYGRIVQTGKVQDRGGQVRVRFEMARDTGDIDGTLAFDGPSASGLAQRDVFVQQEAASSEEPVMQNAVTTLASLEALYVTARESGDQKAIKEFNAAAAEHAARIGADITTLVRIIADTYNATHRGWSATAGD